MLCQECNQNKASVHLTKIVNGIKTEVQLCEKCALKKGDLDFSFEPKFSLQNFLAGFLNEAWVSKQGREKINPARIQCPRCALTFAQFSQIGRFGCSNCYLAFGDEKLKPMLRRIHGSVNHVGKIPCRTGGATMIKRDLGKLRRQLQYYVRKEEYERAAEIRDSIRSLEKDLKEREEGAPDG